jgi:hypothetical protein
VYPCGSDQRVSGRAPGNRRVCLLEVCHRKPSVNRSYFRLPLQSSGILCRRHDAAPIEARARTPSFAMRSSFALPTFQWQRVVSRRMPRHRLTSGGAWRGAGAAAGRQLRALLKVFSSHSHANSRADSIYLFVKPERGRDARVRRHASAKADQPSEDDANPSSRIRPSKRLFSAGRYRLNN